MWNAISLVQDLNSCPFPTMITITPRALPLFAQCLIVLSISNDIILFDSINGSQTGTTTPGMSRLGSNSFEGVLYIPQKFSTGWFSLVLRHNNLFRLFNTKSSLYIKYMICKFILLITFLNEPQLIFCTHLNGFTYFYLIQIILFTIYPLFSHKRFQVFLCITNNSIKHQSFVYTQLNDQTVLFQTNQFSISHLFAHSLIVKLLYLTLT